jgi:hypothetical protein
LWQVLITRSEEVKNGLVSDFGDGSYSAMFSIFTAGSYALSAFTDSKTILRSAPITVVPADPATSQIVLSAPIPLRKSAAADLFVSFQLRDQYSNIIHDCLNTTAKVTVTEAFLSITNQTLMECYFGSFNSSIVIRRSGSYLIDLTWAKFPAFGSILGSPFPCNVVSANADPAQCVAESRFLSIGGKRAEDISTVGYKRSLKIFARDSWGNDVQNDPYSVVETFLVYLAAVGRRCSPACPSSCNILTGLPEADEDVCVPADVINNYDSTFTAEWIATISDSYSVVATLRGVPIRSSPFSFTSAAGTISLRTSTLSNIPTSLYAGFSATFFAKTMDEWGNKLFIGEKVCCNSLTSFSLEQLTNLMYL